MVNYKSGTVTGKGTSSYKEGIMQRNGFRTVIREGVG